MQIYKSVLCILSFTKHSGTEHLLSTMCLVVSEVLTGCKKINTQVIVIDSKKCII